MGYLGDYNKKEGYFAGLRPEMLGFLPVEGGPEGAHKQAHEAAHLVLDVGCSSGLFGRSLKENFPVKVHGIELNPSVQAEAEKNLDRVWIGDVGQILRELPSQTYDAVFFNDVLEHLVSPDQALAEVKPLLKDQGVVIASIPNLRHHKVLRDLIFKRDFEYRESGVMDQTHLRFFTAKSMRRLFVNAGYEILKFEGINPTKSWSPYILNLLSLGLFGWDTRYLQFVVVARPGHSCGSRRRGECGV